MNLTAQACSTGPHACKLPVHKISAEHALLSPAATIIPLLSRTCGRTLAEVPLCGVVQAVMDEMPHQLHPPDGAARPSTSAAGWCSTGLSRATVEMRDRRQASRAAIRCCAAKRPSVVGWGVHIPKRACKCGGGAATATATAAAAAAGSNSQGARQGCRRTWLPA